MGILGSMEWECRGGDIWYTDNVGEKLTGHERFSASKESDFTQTTQANEEHSF